MREHRPVWVWLVGGHVGGKVADIFLVRVLEAPQAEFATRVLPCLPFTIPVKAKLRQNLPHFRCGCLPELNPNPFADHLGEIKQAGIAGFQKLQNFIGGQGAVFLPRLGVNRQAIVFPAALVVCSLLNCADRLPRPQFISFDVVFMVFFFCSAVRLRSVAFHEKAEPTALPRGSGPSEGTTSGRAGEFGDAVRATERNTSRKNRI